MDDSRLKQERKVSVQARIDLVDLANLAEWWRIKGVYIRSVSQLISSSIELLVDVMEKDGYLERDITTLADAKRLMETRGLMTRTMYKKNGRKMGVAMSFESLRQQGVDPAEYVPRQYNTMHRQQGGRVKIGDSRVGEALSEAERAMLAEQKEIELAKAVKSGLINTPRHLSEDELEDKGSEIVNRDKVRLEQEQNVDLSNMDDLIVEE